MLRLAVFLQRLLVDLPCRIDDKELSKFPNRGPLLAVGNHINSLEVPVLFSHMYPRLVTGLAKIETWNHLIFRMLFNVYRAVPVRRGEADLNAINLCIERLNEGYILAVAPEGTRSHTGVLQQGHPGVAMLAVKSGAPVQPFAHFGVENVWNNLRRLKRTDFHIRVGNPFKIDLHGERLNRGLVQKVVDEMMYQVAAMLPPFYRGYYGNLALASEDYLCFESGVESNLSRAREIGHG